MASPITNAPTISAPQRPERPASAARTSPQSAYESVARRALTASLRSMHESSFFFSGIVKGFRLLQRAGVNLTPNHFYWPIPDLAELEERRWPIYTFPAGCDFQLGRQVKLARRLAVHFGEELKFSSIPDVESYHYQNGYFESCDAEVAYSMVRHWKPNRIVEIGSGYSTRVMAAALRANLEQDGRAGELITVDPHPERLPANGLGKFVTVFVEPVQKMDLLLFSSLEAGDILFIDSSHVVAVGSDVVQEYLQILPRLKPGVVVHVHDIFLPFDYPREAVLNRLWLWSEQYLLQAFLSFNTEFEVLWSGSAMQGFHSNVLEQCFPNWKHSYSAMPAGTRRFVPTQDGNRVWPSSFWMRRVVH